MKRKFVLRLLATVMAAALVVTGVPGTALTGIETVYATQPTKTDAKSSYITIGATADNYYAIVEYDVVTALDDYAGATTTNTLNWKKATTTSLTFNDLKADTAYVVFTTGTSDGSASTNKLSADYTQADTLGADGNLKTEKADISEAVVVLDKDTYTYSKLDIYPSVKSITLGGTTYTNTDITKYFTISKLASPTVASGATFTVGLTTDGSSKFTGTSKTVTGVKITALNLSDSSIDAYITSYTGGKYSLYDGCTKYVYAEGQLLTENSGSTVSDYYVVEDNTKEVGGTATVTVYGNGNYTGSLTTTYTVRGNSVAAPTVIVTPTTSSIDVKVDADKAVIAANTYEYAISTFASPSSITYVDGNSDGTYSFTTCDGKALAANTTYYVWARIKATKTTYASANATGISSSGYKLAIGDLSKATVTVKDGGAAISAAGVAYDGAALALTAEVKVNGETLTAGSAGGYKLSYAYVTTGSDGKEVVTPTDSNDGTTMPKDAGTVRVFVKPYDNTYCGEAHVDFTINKIKVSGAVTLSTDATKSYDGKNTRVSAAATIKITPDDTVSGETSNLKALASPVAGAMIFNLSGSDVGDQTVTSVSFDYAADKAEVLKNYDVTISNLNDLKIKIQKNTKVTITVPGTNNVYYGKPNTLGVTNTAGLDMTYKVVSGFEDYISVDAKGVVTVKKIAAGVTPQVEVSVEQKDTTNYNSTNTQPEKVTVTLNKAEVTGTANAALLDDGTYKLSARPDATVAQILKALNIVLKYQNNEDNNNKTYTEIKLDESNTSILYTTGAVSTDVKPTTEGKYTVKVTYTGSDAAYLDKVDTSASGVNLSIELTISKAAASLAEEVSVVGAHLETYDGVSYLYNDDNELVKNGFQTIDGKTYYANKYGVVVTGKIFSAGGSKYYAMATGVIRKNGKYKTVDGSYIYAYASGKLLVNAAKTIGNATYVADKNGKLVKEGFATVKNGKTYYVKSYKAVKNKIFNYSNGKSYIANAKGVILKGKKVVTFNGKKYYVGYNGALAKSKKVTVGNKVYTTNAKGVVVKTTTK